MTYIYGLKDPRDDALHYIGKSDNPKRRLGEHLEDGKNSAKARWLNELVALGLQPEVITLEEVSDDRWQKSERKWISIGRGCCWPLTNISAGGSGGRVGKGPSFDFFKPFLTEGLWQKFDGLDVLTKWDICHMVAVEVMSHSWIAIKSAGGDPGREYNIERQFHAGVNRALKMVTAQ